MRGIYPLVNSGSVPVEGPGFLKVRIPRTQRRYLFPSDVTTFSCSVPVSHSGATCSVTCTSTVPTFSSAIVVTHSGATVAIATNYDSGTFSSVVESGFLSRVLQNLLCFSATPVEADFIQFVAEFNALIDDSSVLTPQDFQFLDQSTYDGELTYEDRDYWIEIIARKYLTLTGRTFGVSTPATWEEADPLGLMKDSSGNLRDDVIIIDVQGVNTDQADTDGFVLITASSNNCTTTDGNAKTPSASMWITQNPPVRRFFAFQQIRDFHEAGGGSVVRFLDAVGGLPDTIETIYFRFGDHVLDKELIWRHRNTTSDPKHRVLQGYPSDARPIIRMGSSVTGVNNDTVVDGPQIYIGFGSNGRDRTRFRNLHFWGNRDGTYGTGSDLISGLIFAQVMFIVSGSDSVSFRRCEFTNYLGIPIDNPDAASHLDTYVDIIHEHRTWSIGDCFSAVQINGSNFDFQYNRVKAADIDIPFSVYTDASASKVISRGTDNHGDNCTIQYNLYEGFSSGDYLRCTPSTGNRIILNYQCHWNIVTCNGYEGLLALAGDVTLENIYGSITHNFIYNWGTADIQPQGGQGVALYGELEFAYNIVAGNIDGQDYLSDLTTNGFRIETMDSDGEAHCTPMKVDAHHNIFWKSGISLGNNGAYSFADSNLAINRLYRNLVYDLPWPLKEENAATDERFDGNINVKMKPSVGIGPNIIDENVLFLPAGNLNNNLALLLRTASTTYTHFDVGDTLAGFTNNIDDDPEFNDPNNGDFRLPVDSPYAVWFPEHMIYRREDIPAWNNNPLDDFCGNDYGIIGEVTSTSAVPTYSATCTVESDNISCIVACSSVQPTFSGSTALTAPNAEVDIDCLFSSFIHECTAIALHSGVTSLSVATFSATGTFITSCSVQLQPVECFITISFDTNQFDTTIYSALYNSFDISI